MENLDVKMNNKTYAVGVIASSIMFVFWLLAVILESVSSSIINPYAIANLIMQLVGFVLILTSKKIKGHMFTGTMVLLGAVVLDTVNYYNLNAQYGIAMQAMEICLAILTLGAIVICTLTYFQKIKNKKWMYFYTLLMVLFTIAYAILMVVIKPFGTTAIEKVSYVFGLISFISVVGIYGICYMIVRDYTKNSPFLPMNPRAWGPCFSVLLLSYIFCIYWCVTFNSRLGALDIYEVSALVIGGIAVIMMLYARSNQMFALLSVGIYSFVYGINDLHYAIDVNNGNQALVVLDCLPIVFACLLIGFSSHIFLGKMKSLKPVTITAFIGFFTILASAIYMMVTEGAADPIRIIGHVSLILTGAVFFIFCFCSRNMISIIDD